MNGSRDSGPEDSGKPGNRAGIPENELSDRLSALGERLGRKIEEKTVAPDNRASRSGMAAALRMASDFVAAVLVGAALGWGIDSLLGVSPWGMIIFLMIGFCAGVLNVLRLAGRVADPHSERSPMERPGKKNDTEGS